MQADGQGVDRPVSFFSKKFNRHQLNYSTIERGIGTSVGSATF